MMPLNVVATSVKLAIPPPTTRALLRPSGLAVAHYQKIKLGIDLPSISIGTINMATNTKTRA